MADKIIAVIPARGGSKRVKNKNITDLMGHPLIAWTINDAHNNDLIERIFVSTNDQSIAKISEDYGAEVIWRPDGLCNDFSKSEDSVMHAIEEKKLNPEIVIMLQCTHPFRDKLQLNNGISHLKKEKADSLFFGTPIWRWVWKRNCEPINYDYKNRIFTQQKEWELVECGDYITKKWVYDKLDNRLGGKITYYEVSKWCQFDIDEPEDLEICRAIAKGMKFHAED